MESIEQTFNGQADFGRRVQCTISRNGDLAYRTYLEVTLPEINLKSKENDLYGRWLDYPGEQLVNMVEVEIGGQRIDRQYGQWMHIWNQLTMSKEQEEGYLKMIGHTTELTYLTDPSFADVDGVCDNKAPPQVCEPRNSLPETTLYIPLQFWFCRNPGLALPLIALQYHEVKINVDLTPIERCLWAGQSSDKTDWTKHSDAYNTTLDSASLYVDYIFLDTEERRRFAQNPHEYLIEQLQFTGEESVGSSSNKIKLNFNHPCKELVWTVQRDDLVEDCDNFLKDKLVCKAYGPQYFNYTDSLDALPNALTAYLNENPNATTGSGTFKNNNEFLTGLSNSGEYMMETYVSDLSFGTAEKKATRSQAFSDAAAYVVSEKSLNMHCWGKNPVAVAKLQLNGQDRFSEREGSYFDLVQPYQHHTRHPDTGINVYSFALRPEEHQPSGTCNFSRIDNATLHLTLSYNTVKGNQTAKVRVYAVNYNVLRIMSGMGGLAYSN